MDRLVVKYKYPNGLQIVEQPKKWYGQHVYSTGTFTVESVSRPQLSLNSAGTRGHIYLRGSSSVYDDEVVTHSTQGVLNVIRVLKECCDYHGVEFQCINEGVLLYDGKVCIV